MCCEKKQSKFLCGMLIGLAVGAGAVCCLDKCRGKSGCLKKKVVKAVENCADNFR